MTEKLEDGQAQPGHTAEPWRIDGSDLFCDILGADGRDVATTLTPGGSGLRERSVRGANARRIVAAVNACIGLSNQALESGVVQEMVEAARWAVMEWRLHGQLTDSCRHLEAALSKVGER